MSRNTYRNIKNPDSETESDSEERLGDKICRNLEISIFHNGAEKLYLPEGLIKQLITHESVQDELKIEPLPEEHDFIDFIVNKANRLFALTCSVFDDRGHILKVMKTFYTRGITNQSLPVELSEETVKVSDNGNSSITGRVISIDKAFKAKKRFWTPSKELNFYQKQWQFLAPVFEEEQFEWDLDKRLTLPLREIGSEAKEGTFGEIHQVEIHPDHLGQSLLQSNGRKTNVAVKEIKTGPSMQDDATEAFKLEATALSKCRHVKHPHMLPCLAAIKMGSTHYFLFPWADGGNLRDFWKSEPSPKLSSDLIMDVLKQLCGLSGALERLHNFVSPDDTDSDSIHEDGGGIRHGDLKPENILRFGNSTSSDVGTLKIADMGLAKHHEVSTRLRKNMTSTKYGTLRYEPPEVGAPRLKSPATSRLYDILVHGLHHS